MAAQTDIDGARRINYWRLTGWGTVAALLLLPLIAMQFTREVNWTGSDFVFAAILLGSVGGALELVMRKSGNTAYRLGTAILVLAAFLLIWINGAVGIIGNEDNPLNLIYGVILLMALAGSIGAGFRPKGMSRAMAATACAQALVTIVAAIAGRAEPPGMVGLIMLNGFFVGAFALSAALFHKSAEEQSTV